MNAQNTELKVYLNYLYFITVLNFKYIKNYIIILTAIYIFLNIIEIFFHI